MKDNRLVEIKINKLPDFSLPHIFECGQCFRWTLDETGAYTGVAFGRAARIFERGGDIYLNCAQGDYEEVWHEYFDMSQDYAALRKNLEQDERMRPALIYGQGIRILRQEPWEALCSFIISQCNNIPRIKGIISKLCMLCGQEIDFSGSTFYCFPSAEKVAELSDNDLDILRSGYRAKYISEAARKIADGKFNLDEIKSLPTKAAKEALLTLNGVGEKVANCVLLFGFHRLDAFPIDVWMKRAIAEFFKEESFDFNRFGDIAGLAQQYLFHYMRNGNEKS